MSCKPCLSSVRIQAFLDDVTLIAAIYLWWGMLGDLPGEKRSSDRMAW